MVRLVLALLSLVLSACAVNATCPTTLLLKDAANVTAAAKYTDDGSGNCQVNDATQDGANVTLGAKNDATWSGSGTGSLISISKYIATNLAGATPLATTGGWTPLLVTSLTNSAQAVKASAGWLGTIQCDNNNNAWTYVQLFNLASGSVTMGVSVPVYVVPLAPGLSNGFVMNTIGLQFSTAMAIGAATSATGAGAPSASITCSLALN